jgi:hypothetical protein
MRAYRCLSQELEWFRRRPLEELVRCIGGPTIERVVRDEAEPLTIEVRIEWADSQRGIIRIRATANGPSWWRLERLEEAVLVPTDAVRSQPPA